METDWQTLDCVVVAEAGNGIEGLEAERIYHPDLLISDIRMTDARSKGVENTSVSDAELLKELLYKILH